MGAPRAWLLDLLDCPPDTDECVPWPFATNGQGYGKVKWGESITAVPRVVLTELVGPPPGPGLEVHAAHTPGVCHNRACVNPRHLRWATAAENNADKLVDGTHPRGEQTYNAKLTNAQALEIYEAAGSNPAIAAQYGVSRALVSQIKSGKSWAWLTGHQAEAA